MLPGYQVFRKDREIGKGGGVLLYVKSKLKCKLLELPEAVKFDCVGIEVLLSTEMSFVFMCLYRHPSASLEFYDQLKIMLNSVGPNKELIILGDFNVNWDNKQGRKNLKLNTEYYNLKQLIEQPTRLTNKSQTRIDLLFTNKPDRITKTYNFLTGISDHNCIFMSRKLNKSRFARPPKAQPSCSINVIPRNQLQNLSEGIKNIDWEEILTSDNIETSCDSFLNKIKNVMSPLSRRGKSRARTRNSPPWLDQNCRDLLKSRDSLLKKYLKSGLSTDRHNFTHIRNKVVQSLRRAKANFFISVIEGAKGNGKKVWQTLNKLLGKESKHESNTSELIIDNVLVNDPAKIANSFNNYFIDSVLEITRIFTPSAIVPRPISNEQPIFQLARITEMEVKKLIGALKCSKTKDAYGIDTNFIKSHSHDLCKPIMHLVNLSISQNKVPLAWKVASVTPVFKSGSKSLEANYRPISILPVISKIAEKWVANQLIRHLDEGPTSLHPMQFGFRAHHSTESANCMFIEKIKCLLDKTSCVSAVFLDLKKAFDTVDHQVLLNKLTFFNFSHSTMQWFGSYLANRTQCVAVNGVKSPFRSSAVGVPQGSILAPLLFSLYINDLPDTCPDINIQMYADDAVIFTHGSNSDITSNKLNSAMARVQDWLNNNCLLLNTTKTVCMNFTKRPVNQSRSKVYIGGVELELVEQFKYLGITLDANLTFKKHIKKVANTIRFSLQNFKQIRPFISSEAAKSYLHCMILSHIEYCFVIWSFAGATTLKPIEQLYKRAVKVFAKKSLSSHYCPIFERHNFLSFDHLRSFKISCLIYKTLNGLAPPPLREYFRRRDNTLSTRSASRGDCEVPFRRSQIGQNSLTVKGGTCWNSLPTPIRDSPTFNAFKKQLKAWLLSHQTCTHV